KRPNWELACEPHSNILCFRWVPEGIPPQNLNQINEKIRKKTLEEGRFYIVQTRLKEVLYLRTSLMNPFTGKEHLTELLTCLEALGKVCLSNG
ncbi:MAG: pyridoxal-dependent decarboxylase, partial [Robiginitalea sp.]